MSDFLNFLLIVLLPFWSVFFSFVIGLSWPVALIWIFSKISPLLSQVLTERGFSFEGFGAQFRVEDKRIAQSPEGPNFTPELTDSRLQLPRTVAINDMENHLKSEIAKLPGNNREEIVLNALAIDRLEKIFAFAYINIFGSQLTLLQRMNERGGHISLSEGDLFFGEVKTRFAELSDWDVDGYFRFLEQQGFMSRGEISFDLTPLGRDFLQFVIRMGLRTDKAF